jgi:DNA repair and recombination protein RAD52
MPTHIDFATEQLAKPLDRKHVLTRSQSGRSLSYVEGWHAIAEANRIFGFDGWTRETVDTRCVAERARKIGQQGRDGWGVSYIAKVRVVALGVTREGTGTGHGIDADLGAAHESAIKEAETDAMKRALMTFGNPFGLALYDKTQANVVDGVEEYEAPGEPEVFPVDPDVARKSAHAIKKERPGDWHEVVSKLRDATTPDELKATAASEYIHKMTEDWPVGFLDQLRDEYRACMSALAAMKEAAE